MQTWTILLGNFSAMISADSTGNFSAMISADSIANFVGEFVER
jgi:hypothetical protein